MNFQRTGPLRLRALTVVAVVALAVVGCQAAGPSPSASARPSASAAPAQSQSPSPSPAGSPAGSADLSQTYATIEEQVRAIRGLEAKNAVDPVVLDDAGIKKLTADGFRKDNPEKLVDANERLLKGLGLLPADADLGDLYVELLGSQVAGLYSPDDKQLYVVSRSGNLGPTEKTTFAHEYTHALQDQNFDINTLDIDEVGEGDRAIARLALVEGDATLTMSLWQIQHLTQAELLQLIGESLNPALTAGLESMPPILRESLLFPYTSGLAFAQGLQLFGWQTVNDAFANPPASTEQILHPEKYALRERPVEVDVPDDLAARMGPGWSVGLEDTFGEFQLRVFLDQAGTAAPVSSADAAAGWGGDRITLLDGPDGAWAIALSTAWDTPADATEFAKAALPVVTKLEHGAVIAAADDRTVTVLLAPSDAVLQGLATALGS
jgi:hypothetical protein